MAGPESRSFARMQSPSGIFGTTHKVMDTAPFTLEITQDAPAVFHAPPCCASSFWGVRARPAKPLGSRAALQSRASQWSPVRRQAWLKPHPECRAARALPCIGRRSQANDLGVLHGPCVDLTNDGFRCLKSRMLRAEEPTGSWLPTAKGIVKNIAVSADHYPADGGTFLGEDVGLAFVFNWFRVHGMNVTRGYTNARSIFQHNACLSHGDGIATPTPQKS